jgi:hypothetical protein
VVPGALGVLARRAVGPQGPRPSRARPVAAAMQGVVAVQGREAPGVRVALVASAVVGELWGLGAAGAREVPALRGALEAPAAPLGPAVPSRTKIAR